MALCSVLTVGATRESAWGVRLRRAPRTRMRTRTHAHTLIKCDLNETDCTRGSFPPAVLCCSHTRDHHWEKQGQTHAAPYVLFCKFLRTYNYFKIKGHTLFFF